MEQQGLYGSEPDDFNTVEKAMRLAALILGQGWITASQAAAKTGWSARRVREILTGEASRALCLYEDGFCGQERVFRVLKSE